MKIWHGYMDSGKLTTFLGKGDLHLVFQNGECKHITCYGKKCWHFNGEIQVLPGDKVILLGTGDTNKDFTALASERKYHLTKYVWSFDVVYQTPTQSANVAVYPHYL